MSWHFSQAMEAQYLAGSCSAGELSAPWSSTPLAPDDSCSAKMKGTLHRSPYGMMFVPSTDARCVAVLTSFLAGFPARESAPLDSGLVSPTPAQDFGANLQESLAKWDPNTSSWKTPQCSFLAGLDVFSVTWPRWGMMRAGECWELTPPVFPITEPAFGWLPTPSGVNGGKNNTMGRVDEWGGSSNPLRGQPIGKALSPNFEEIVMGWPIDWTAQTPLETAKFRQWCRSHGIS